jgi:hypothetical protein
VRELVILPTQEYTSPLEPLLHRLSEEFIDDRDLSARLQRLFKVKGERGTGGSGASGACGKSSFQVASGEVVLRRERASQKQDTRRRNERENSIGSDLRQAGSSGQR